ncbi:MAG: hypothetical protein ABEI98_01675 [Halorhabdus sp.]
MSTDGIVRCLSCRRTLGTVTAVFVAVAALIAVALFTGLLGVPSVAIEDVGDWATVSEAQTDVITTVRVHNPNPIGLPVGDSVSATNRL